MRSIPLADHPITSQPTYDECVLKGSASAALKQRLHRVLAIRGLVSEGRNRSRWDLRPLRYGLGWRCFESFTNSRCKRSIKSAHPIRSYRH